MMATSVLRYQLTLYLQIIILIGDLFFNSFTEVLRSTNYILLILNCIQLVLIVVGLIVLATSFFQTYICEAGLMPLLCRRFYLTLAVIVIYFGLTTALYIWGLLVRWNDVNVDVWNGGYVALYVIQRTWAIAYYYFYKRTALRLGDPHFYEESDWIRREFELRR